MASALLNLSLGRRERGKEKKEGEKEKGREGEQVRARGATVSGLPSLRNLGSLGAPPLQSGLIPTNSMDLRLQCERIPDMPIAKRGRERAKEDNGDGNC